MGKCLRRRLINEENSFLFTALHIDTSNGVYSLDLTKIESIREKISEFKPNIIFHLGGLVNLSRDFDVGQKCIDINIKGTYNLLESLRIYKPQLFILASTEEVYGNGKIPYVEEQIPDPPSPYAISKIASENLAAMYALELDFPLIIFRIGTMYGPEDSINRLIPNIILKAIKNEPILLNSGMKKRDYIYIEDVVDALVTASGEKLPEQVLKINLGGSKSFALKEVVGMILDYTKSKSQVVYGAVKDRIGESGEWLLDNHNAGKFLGWEPKTSILEGLKKTVDYYRYNIKRIS